jgi:hypothetical protein
MTELLVYADDDKLLEDDLNNIKVTHRSSY